MEVDTRSLAPVGRNQRAGSRSLVPVARNQKAGNRNQKAGNRNLVPLGCTRRVVRNKRGVVAVGVVW